MRTLTALATTEKDRETGAYIVRCLKIEWGDTPGADDVYYAAEVLTLPRQDSTTDTANITTEGRIKSFGQMTMKAAPGQVGGYGQMTFTMEDGDQKLRARIDTTPGVQNKLAYLYLYLQQLGTEDEDPPTWHRVTEFGGTLSTPLRYDEVSATWAVTLKGFEHFEDRRLGTPFDEQTFPEASCEDVEDGAVVPIVFGKPCFRSPCLLIDRPGFAFLRFSLGINDTTFEMHVSAKQGQFGDTTQLDGFGNPIAKSFNIVVGYPGNFERITGDFFVAADPTSSDDSKIFNIATRDAIYATGTSPGTFAKFGWHHFLIKKADVPDANVRRGGYTIFFKDDSGNWNMRIIDEWFFTGSNIATFRFGKKEKRPSTGALWKIVAFPGYVPVWPSGTPVYEDTNWKYIANFLPSESVIRLEARSSAYPTRGEGDEPLFLTYNPTSYTVDLDDRAYNVILGRDKLKDPGVTTFVVAQSPTSLGFSEDRIYATMNGIYDRVDWVKEELTAGVFTYVNSPPAAARTAFDNAGDIIGYLVDTKQLTDIGKGFRDTTSFDAVSSQPAGSDQILTKAAFAITKTTHFNELASDLCYQHQCLFFWDQAKIFLKKLTATPVSSVLTLTTINTKSPFAYEALSIKEHPTVMRATFQPHVVSPTITYTRISGDARAVYGTHETSINLWSIQLPSSAVSSLEFWLRFLLGRQRQITITTFLNALHVQPGDTITFDLVDGNGNVVIGNLARVVEIRHSLLDVKRQQMNTMEIVAEIGLWAFGVDVVTQPAGFDTLTDTCRTGSGSGKERAYNFAQLGFPELLSRDFWDPATGKGIGGIPLSFYDTGQPIGGGGGGGLEQEGMSLVGKAMTTISKSTGVLSGLTEFTFQTYLLTDDSPPTWVPDPDEPAFTAYNGSPDAETSSTQVFCAVGFFEVSKDEAATTGQTDGIWLLLHWLDCGV